MFRTIRKKKNEISTDAAKTLLQSSRRGVLAVNGDDGYPYAIPINYVYDDDAQKIYFREITHSDGWNIADSTAGNGRISHCR